MKTEKTVSTIPNQVVAKEGNNVLLKVGDKKLIITPYAPVVLKPRFTAKELRACEALSNLLVDGILKEYKSGTVLPKNPTGGIPTKKLLDEKDVSQTATIIDSIVDGKTVREIVIPDGITRQAYNNTVDNIKKQKDERIKSKSVNDDSENSILRKKNLQVEGFEEVKAYVDRMANSK